VFGSAYHKNPTKKHFATITRQLRVWGYKADWKQLELAYFRSSVLSPKRYRTMLRLLSIFAQHFSILSNQLVVRCEEDEPTNMARARQFIEDHQAEPLSLGRIAHVANISRHYFCKMFKKATGISFIDHLSTFCLAFFPVDGGGTRIARFLNSETGILSLIRVSSV
jgi:YesN/AraC family two-component response regulator